MEYKVIPIKPIAGRNESVDSIAKQIGTIINNEASNGWLFIRVETIETLIAGENGCFGFGAKPPYNQTFQFIVFGK